MGFRPYSVGFRVDGILFGFRIFEVKPWAPYSALQDPEEQGPHFFKPYFPASRMPSNEKMILAKEGFWDLVDKP